MNTSISDRIDTVKELFSQGEYEKAAGVIILLMHTISELRSKGNDAEANKIESEISKLRISVFEKVIEKEIEKVRDLIAKKDPECAFAIVKVENLAKGINKTLNIEKLKKEAYTIGIESKLGECKNYLTKGNFNEAYKAYKTAEIFGNKIGKDITDKKLLSEIYTGLCKLEIEAAKKNLEDKNIGCIEKILIAEKYAEKAENTALMKEVAELKKNIFKFGVESKTEEAKDLSKKDPAKALVAVLSAEKYASQANIILRIEQLKKEIYENLIRVKFDEAKKGLEKKDHRSALSALAVIRNSAKASKTERIDKTIVSEEAENLEKIAYNVAIENLISEGKNAIKNNEYTKALTNCKLIESYAGKLNIKVDTWELKKEAYNIACFSKINEAKELLNKNDADGYAALNIAEAYAKKANIEIPEEIKKLKPLAHKVFMDYKFSTAKETFESDPDEAVVALSLVEKHAKLANVPLPDNFENIKTKAYENKINVKIKDAEEALKAKDYEGAIGSLSVAKTCAEKIKVTVPEKVEELRKNAYAIGVHAKIADIKEAIRNNDYVTAVGGCNVVELFGKRAGITVPKELNDLRLESYKLAVKEKLKEAKEAIKNKDYSEVFSACAGVEIYGKKANIDVKKEFPEIGSMWMEGYKLAYNAKLEEAKNLILQNDPGCYSALKSAEKYAESAGMQLPDMALESLKKEVYKVVIYSKELDINNAIKEGNYEAAIAAFNSLTYYANLSGLSPREDINQLKKRVLNLGIESKLKEAKEAYNSGDFGAGLSALSIAETLASRIGVSADKILEERKKLTVAFLNAKISEIDKFLNEGNFDDAITTLRAAERQSARANIPFPEKLTEISKRVYNTGIDVKIKEANEALSARNFGDAYVALKNACEFATKIGKNIPEADVLEKKCFEIGVEERIKSAEKNIKEGNYEDAIGDVIAAKAYADRAGRPINIYDLERQAYKIGIDAQIEEMRKAINNESYDDATLAYYTIKFYAEKISAGIPPEVETLMLDVYKLGYKVKKEEAINHANVGEFTEAIGCLKEMLYCAEKAGIILSKEFEEMRKEIYNNGIKARLKSAVDALFSGEYLETLGNLRVAEAYSKECSLNFSQIAKDAGFDIKKITFDAYMTGIKKNLEVSRKAADRGEIDEALSAAAIVRGYANDLEIEEPKELEHILMEVEKKKK